MKDIVFTGAATAIVTPLTKDGIDYKQFARLIEWQIAEGVAAIVAVGTTGEGSTLSDAEHKEAIKFCVDQVAGRIPVIAGTGSNDTAYAIELTKYSCEVTRQAEHIVFWHFGQRALLLLFNERPHTVQNSGAACWFMIVFVVLVTLLLLLVFVLLLLFMTLVLTLRVLLVVVLELSFTVVLLVLFTDVLFVL